VSNIQKLHDYSSVIENESSNGSSGAQKSVLVPTEKNDSSLYIWDVFQNGVLDTFWMPSVNHDTLYQSDFE